jgi:tellurite resistance protein TehA-like permease
MNNFDILKNPIYSALIGFILTIIYLYFHTIYKKEKKETTEYLIISSYVGILSYFLIYFTQMESKINLTPKNMTRLNPGLPDF